MADCKTCKRTDIKCCHTCARNPYTCNVWHRCEKDCEGYKPQTKTNFDRIKAMSMEELAEFLIDHHGYPCKYCIGCHVECHEGLAEWLKSEAKEEKQ